MKKKAKEEKKKRKQSLWAKKNKRIEFIRDYFESNIYNHKLTS